MEEWETISIKRRQEMERTIKYLEDLLLDVEEKLSDYSLEQHGDTHNKIIDYLNNKQG